MHTGDSIVEGDYIHLKKDRGKTKTKKANTLQHLKKKEKNIQNI